VWGCKWRSEAADNTWVQALAASPYEIVLSALIPVVLLAGAGWWAGHRGWIDERSVGGLTQLVFMLLTPALLFRTMARMEPGQLNFSPLLAYFAAAFTLLGALVWWGRGTREAAVKGLASTFSNTLMIGVPIVTIAYGPPGLVVLITVISVHALVLLTATTVLLEAAVAREAQARGETPQGMARTVYTAARNSIIHPVPLPILAGLAWGELAHRTGWSLPAAVDKSLEVLGNANGPMALLLVGITLAHTRLGEHWRGALKIVAVKLVAFPLLVAAFGVWVFGLSGLPLAVITLTAALPIGANVFLFSQRYGVAQQLITSAVALSTVVGLASVSLTMLAVQKWLG
jgi:predicted permease